MSYVMPLKWHLVLTKLCAMYGRYSPNIKEIEVLEKKRVRRAKLYYLREKMDALKKQ